MRVFLLVGLLVAWPGMLVAADRSADVLLAIEAARHAQTESARWVAALELETLALEDAPGAASAMANLIVEGDIEGTGERAREWARRGHELGEPDATMLLARLHAQGIGGEPDNRRAAELAREAARAGLPAAAVLVYELLIDTDQSRAALDYLMQAAESGYPDAQHLLGIHFAAGRGVERNYEEAFFWLVLAEAHGVGGVADQVASVAGVLTPEQQQSVIQSAMEWQPQ